MNRDAILATGIGLVLGLTITGLVIVGPRLLGTLGKLHLPITSQKSKDTPTPSPTAAPAALTIAAPLPEAIENDTHLVVSGKSEPQTTIIVNGPIDDDVTTSGADGQYAGKITLVEGKNDITVTSYDTKGKTASQLVTVYYTPDNF